MPMALVLTSTEFERSNSLVKGLSPLTPREKGVDSNGHSILCGCYNFSICFKYNRHYIG